MDERGEARRRRDPKYREMLEAIRDRALRFLQVAPAMEGRREIALIKLMKATSPCDPDICSVELLRRADLIIVRCHTCKRGGTWRELKERR